MKTQITRVYESLEGENDVLHTLHRYPFKSKKILLASKEDYRTWNLRFNRDYILYRDKRIVRYRIGRKLKHTIFEYKIPHDSSLVSRMLAKKKFDSLHEKITYKGRVSQHLVSTEGAPFKYLERQTIIHKGTLKTKHDV